MSEIFKMFKTQSLTYRHSKDDKNERIYLRLNQEQKARSLKYYMCMVFQRASTKAKNPMERDREVFKGDELVVLRNSNKDDAIYRLGLLFVRYCSKRFPSSNVAPIRSSFPLFKSQHFNFYFSINILFNWLSTIFEIAIVDLQAYLLKSW